jgi:SOS response regulatory protein OraA/RecX
MTNNKQQDIRLSQLRSSLKHYALFLLSRRDYSFWKLEQKLKLYGWKKFSEPKNQNKDEQDNEVRVILSQIIYEIMEELRNQGYFCPDAYTQGKIFSWLKRGIAPKQIFKKLQAEYINLSSHEFDEYLLKYQENYHFNEDLIDVQMNHLWKKCRNKSLPKIWSFYQSKGFTYSQIQKFLKDNNIHKTLENQLDNMSI